MTHCNYKLCENILTGRKRVFCSHSCKNKHHVDKRRKKLKRLAVEYKGGCCENCGYNKCLRALGFHHKDPDQKDFALSSKGITRSWEKIKNELDKCQMLCANCHMEVHELIQGGEIGRFA